ncbi:MAG: hypothetical protein OXJ54_10920 [Gemmatimonadetes bacterium]|nr:hypothetical protein [Candidatus Palauibacter rhopaloidicola]
MELDVIIGLVTIWLTIVVVGLAVAGRTRKLEEKIDRTSGELRDELRSEIQGVRGEIGSLRTEVGILRGSVGEEIASVRGEIASVREELGGRIDAVVAELTRTRMAVARLEGSVLGIAPPDTGTDTA